MKLNDFLELISTCPTCGSRMVYQIVELHKCLGNRKVAILDCSCKVNHFHYESYGFVADDTSNPEIELSTLSIYFMDFSTTWFDDKKELVFRESDGTIVARAHMPDKNIFDWLVDPYKNIVDKIKNMLILK
jgi:hypothetical protein